MRGRGRGRGRRQRSINDDALPAAASAIGANGKDAKPALLSSTTQASRSIMMTTPLGALLRIEATIWMNARGGRSVMSLDNFYALTRAHEWQAGTTDSGGNGATNATEASTTTAPRQISELCIEVNELSRSLSEEERILFDLMAVTSWEINCNLPLYRLGQQSPQKKIQIEMVLQPQGTEPTANGVTPTRSEMLSSKYHYAQKCYTFDSTTVKMDAIFKWWANSKRVLQLIISHRETKAASAAKAESVVKVSVKSNGADSSGVEKQAAIINGDQKMTLDERVRARALLNAAASKPSQAPSQGKQDDSNNKALLELADALRSYAQRRGSAVGGDGGGGSALDRLRSRDTSVASSTPATATKKVARLPVSDLIKDARVSWGSVVNESVDQRDIGGGGSKSHRSGETSLVGIDLGRVLFLLRLKMVPAEDVSDKRQMEWQLLELLERLATLVPTWIHLHKVPPSLKYTSKSAVLSSSKKKLNIRQSIIVIRNDAVDYTKDVRSKLGARVQNTAKALTTGTSNPRMASSTSITIGNKRSLAGVEDHIVPPYFRRMYGKALLLESDEASKKMKQKTAREMK